MEQEKQQLSDIEQVLNFLRKNGLSESESALMDDILEKSHLGSFDFQRFIFPVVVPSSLPPLLKILSAPPPPSQSEMMDDDEEEVKVDGSSSDDEFVSLNSSTTDLCSSSEFTNPYGIRTRVVSSQASSDRLSQFGTARDYHDFDLQNDLNWYTERDEDYAMPPLFDNSDPFSGPTEDKFVMTSDKENQDENLQMFLDPILDPFEQTSYLDKPWPLTSVGYVKKDGVKITDYYDLDGKCVERDLNGATLYGSFEGDNLKDFIETEAACNSNICSFCLEENKRSCDCCLVVESKNCHLPQNQMGDKDVDLDMNTACKGVHGGNLHEDREGDASKLKESDAAKVKEGDADATNNELLMHANEDEYEVFDLRIIHRKNRTGFEENKDLPIVLNSVIGSRYCVIEYLGSAAFSRVVQAHDPQMGIDVCLKIIKNDKDFFDQSLDEIKLLKFVNKYDPEDERHILRLYDYFYFQEHLIIVCELLRANLYEYQKYNKECGGEPYFTLKRLQVITRQCLEALEYLHDLGIIHCDLKPENILIKSYSRCEIKVIDLGSSCFKNDNLSLYVQSRSYRAPEVIIGLPYDQKIDLWSLGCILAELYSGDVLFPNDELVVLLARVIGMLGPIDIEMLENGQETDKYFTKDFDLYYLNEETDQMEYIIPQETSLEEHLQVSDALFLDFVKSLLEINPQRRPTASEALQHPWLSSPV
uniref:dual specificity protein kinase CLK1-like n=1 Tax=Erigeron canadensis TaxID=72917 RepID=UPI001CB8EE84|nr:dual specificity protein kinase CLK1-like [Erigeron canadensis]